MSRTGSALLAALLWVGLALLDAHAVRADEPRAPDETNESPNVALGRAISFYETGRNQECAEAFRALLARADTDANLGRRNVERARVYYAACLIAIGKEKEADEQFRSAILDNPQIATPSSIVFPGAVVDRFLRVRATMLDELRRSQEERARVARAEAERAAERARQERSRVEALERLASQEAMIEKNRRWLATVPFGVGQFQNGDTALGAVFLTSEALLAATAVTAVSVQLSLYSAAQGGNRLSTTEARDITANLRTAQSVFLVSTAGFLATAAGGIVEAHLSFVPETPAGVRKRPASALPAARQSKPASVSFGAAPVAGGAAIGLSGVFW